MYVQSGRAWLQAGRAPREALRSWAFGVAGVLRARTASFVRMDAARSRQTCGRSGGPRRGAGLRVVAVSRVHFDRREQWSTVAPQCGVRTGSHFARSFPSMRRRTVSRKRSIRPPWRMNARDVAQRIGSCTGRSTAGRAGYPTGPGCASRAGVITSGNAWKTFPPFARVPNLIAASANAPRPAGGNGCDDA